MVRDIEEIPIEGLICQQLIDFRYWAAKERLQHRNNQLAQIAKLDIGSVFRTLSLWRNCEPWPATIATALTMSVTG